MATVKETGTKEGQAKAEDYAVKGAEGPRGQFVWHELATTDPKAAEAYYGKVIGWKAKPFEGADPGHPYTLLMTGSAMNGGLMELPEMARENGAPPHWITYIGVADVDAGVAQVKKLGGKVHYGPEDIPDVGRFAIVADPQGASFALFTPRGDPDAPRPTPGPGSFSWHELSTTDADAAWRFYETMFGWKKTDAMDMGGGNMYQMFGLGGPSVGGLSKRADVSPHWLPYVIVEDVDAAVALAKANGGQVVFGPMEVPGGDRVACASDAQGATLGLHEMANG